MPEKTEAENIAREIITVLHDKVDAGICELDPALIAEVLGPRLAQLEAANQHLVGEVDSLAAALKKLLADRASGGGERRQR